MRDEGEITQEEADELCQAASSLFFTLLIEEAERHRCSVVMPRLLAPPAPVPAPEKFSAEALGESMAFLVRLGIVRKDDWGRMRLPIELDARID